MGIQRTGTRGGNFKGKDGNRRREFKERKEWECMGIVKGFQVDENGGKGGGESTKIMSIFAKLRKL